MANDTCVKSSMAPQAYTVFITHDHDISGWKILSIFIYSCAPHLGGINSDVRSDLATLAFNNREQLEDFHITILRIQQEILLSGETVSPTRLLFEYMKEFSKSGKPGAFIAPKMIDLITLLDNNRKSDV